MTPDPKPLHVPDINKPVPLHIKFLLVVMFLTGAVSLIVSNINLLNK